MAKFKKGDTIIVKGKGFWINSVGVVDEDNSRQPYVLFCKGKVRTFLDEDSMELCIDPAPEISKIINQSIDRENSWDDSVVVSESIPIDKFEFRYADEYGREVIHKFSRYEMDYGLEDVIAEFSHYLMGIGWGREDVYKYIREDRL